MDEVKVIVPLSVVPDDSTVTKRTGTKEYTKRSKLTVYGPGKEIKSIEAGEGVVFLIDDSGNINAMSETTEVGWLACEYDLQVLFRGDLGSQK